MRTGRLRPVTGGRGAAVVWLKAGVVCAGDNRPPPARGPGRDKSCVVLRQLSEPLAHPSEGCWSPRVLASPKMACINRERGPALSLLGGASVVGLSLRWSSLRANKKGGPPGRPRRGNDAVSGRG